MICLNLCLMCTLCFASRVSEGAPSKPSRIARWNELRGPLYAIELVSFAVGARYGAVPAHCEIGQSGGNSDTSR